MECFSYLETGLETVKTLLEYSSTKEVLDMLEPLKPVILDLALHEIGSQALIAFMDKLSGEDLSHLFQPLEEHFMKLANDKHSSKLLSFLIDNTHSGEYLRKQLLKFVAEMMFNETAYELVLSHYQKANVLWKVLDLTKEVCKYLDICLQEEASTTNCSSFFSQLSRPDKKNFIKLMTQEKNGMFLNVMKARCGPRFVRDIIKETGYEDEEMIVAKIKKNKEKLSSKEFENIREFISKLDGVEYSSKRERSRSRSRSVSRSRLRSMSPIRTRSRSRSASRSASRSPSPKRVRKLSLNSD